MICPIHLRELIINPTLKHLDMYSPAASNLLLGTAAQESRFGYFLMQVDSHNRPQGPALGIFQCEPATHDDIWDNYLKFRPSLYDKVASLGMSMDATEMIHNMKYATAIARIKYWRHPAPLPQAGDTEGLAHTWKNIYNSKLGKGTVQEYIDNYIRYVGDPL